MRVMTFGVATGEETWELRLVMKSENVRENMGFSGQNAITVTVCP